MIDDLSPPRLHRAVSRDAVNDPSAWRRSAVRIKRKTKSYAKGDEVPQKIGEYRGRARLSMPHHALMASNMEESILPSTVQNIRKKKMSLQVPIFSDSSPIAAASSGFKSSPELETTPEETDTPYVRSISPNFSPPSTQQDVKQKKGHRKHRSISTILKPIWQSEKVEHLVEKATEKAKPILESEAVTYLTDKYDKVFSRITEIRNILVYDSKANNILNFNQ